MGNTAVTDQELQQMLDEGARRVVENYVVFRRSFGPTAYMSELGMTDIIMAYGQDWANQHQKKAVWEKTGNENMTGSDFHVCRQTGVNLVNQDVETVYFQAKTTKTNTATNLEYADFIHLSNSGKFQNLLLKDYVKARNDEGHPSRGYYICYGPTGVMYVEAQKIGLFIDTQIAPKPPTDVAWNTGMYGVLAKDTMDDATNVN